MNVSIVIPNWNGRELLAEYFPSVVRAAEDYRARSNARVEIIVVDDGSTDDSVRWLQAKYANNDLLSLVELNRNVGFLRAVNRGFSAARYDRVFLLNSDVRAASDCIEPLTKHFSDPNVFAVCCRAGRIGSERLDGGGKIGRFERGFWRVFLNYEAISEEATNELISFYGSGGYTMYDRTKWNELGGFQDLLSPNYWEDVEISYRAWKRGWKVLFEPGSHALHMGSATMGKVPVRAEMSIITERNRLLMTWINLHDGKMLASHFGWLILKLIGSALSFKWNHLRSFSRAVGLLSKVRAARRIEKKYALTKDGTLKRKFEEIVKKPGIYLVATESDEIAFRKMRNSLIANRSSNI